MLSRRLASSRVFAWILFAVLVCRASIVALFAEENRLTGFRPSAFVIENAHVVVQPGQTRQGVSVLIRNGVIEEVAPKIEIPVDAEVIPGEGLYLYAAFIDAAGTEILDPEQKAKPAAGRKWDVSRYVLAATRPDNRKGLTPEYRAAEHLKIETSKLEAFRKAGFAAVNVLPHEGLAAGEGALVSTAGKTPRDSIIAESTFPVFSIKRLGGSTYPATLMGATAHLRQAFLDAKRYQRHWELFRAGSAVARPPVDETLATLHEVMTSSAGRPVFVVQSRDDIHRALDFSAEFDLDPILWGADEAHLCQDRLARAQTDLILNLDFGDKPKIDPPKEKKELSADFSDPIRVQHDRLDKWRARIAGVARLKKRGLRIGLSSHDLKSPEEILKAVRLLIEEGLKREDALALLTTEPAAILGMSEKLGTIEPGRLGNVVVMTRPFDDEKTKVRYLFVDGDRYEYHKDAKADDPVPAVAAKSETETEIWNLTIQSHGNPSKARLEVVPDGETFSGRFDGSLGKGKLIDGKVSEDRVEFSVRFGKGESDSVTFGFTGKRDDAGFSGRMQSPFGGSAKWSAVRGDSPEKKDPSKPAVAERNTPDKLPSELDRDRLARPFQTNGNVFIKNATILTGTGETLESSSLLIREGKIAAIGKNLRPDEGMRVIDATGRFVMPGIIDTHSHIMITDGINEFTQSIVPEVRVRDVIDTDDVSEYRALAGGVTTARLFHGSSNVIGGQDAVIKLKHGKTAQEHLIPDAPQGVKFALGENVKYRTTRFPNTRLGVEATLNRAFMESLDYRRRWNNYERDKNNDDVLPPRRDLRLEALADIVNHKKFIHSHCYRADEILMLLRVASELGVRVWSLQHVLEGYKIAPEIVAHGASCSTFSDWWAYKVEAYDATPYNAALLNEAGANIVIKSDDAELIRHLYHEAAKTVRYGNMPIDDAIATITINPAKELGLDDRIGSLEVGKHGDVAIFNGHPLNSFSRCEMTLIEGKVYFSREHAPTAMSETAQKRSAKPTKLHFTSLEARARELNLEEIKTGRYALTNATLYPVASAVVEKGTLLIEDGRIAGLGEDIAIPSGSKVIDCSGMHIAPGFIDAGTQLGLVEIGKVRETHDYSEGGVFQPDLRAGVGLNVDSELIPVARSGGITSILIRPNGGVIAGQASIAELSGWTAPQMIKDYEAGLQILWTSDKKRQKELVEFLDEARLYDRLQAEAKKNQREGLIRDPRLEALRPYINGDKPVFVEAESRKAIAEAILFAEKEKLKMIITGGTDAWKLADKLKEREIPVIVGPVMRSPISKNDPSDAPYANPGRLFEAGVTFCIRSDNASNSRNTPFEAAMAVAFGLPEAEGLKAVTLSAAEILGIENEVGSLSEGKSANFVIHDGPPLQHTSNIKGVFIEGKPFAPDSRQIRFYKRYRERLKQQNSSELSRTAKNGQCTGE